MHEINISRSSQKPESLVAKTHSYSISGTQPYARVSTHNVTIDSVIKSPYSTCTGTFVSFNKTTDFNPGTFSVNPFYGSKYAITHVGQDFDLFGEIEGLRLIFTEVKGFLTLTPAVLSDTAAYMTTPMSHLAVDPVALRTAMYKANAKVKETYAEFLTSLGELPETLRMLNTPGRLLVEYLKDATKFIDSMRKLRRNPFALAGKSADYWLTWRYGVRPLVKDIDDICKGLAFMLDGQISTGITSRAGRTSNKTKTNGNEGLWYGPYNIEGLREWSTTIENNLVFRFYFIGSKSVAKVGLSLEQIPSVIWELCPYSFVFDWFLDIGSWLKAVLPQPGISILGSSYTVQKIERYIWTLSSVRRRTYGKEWTPVRIALYVSRQVNDRVIPPETPSFGFPPPGQLLNSISRSLDALSLIWQKCPTKRH